MSPTFGPASQRARVACHSELASTCAKHSTPQAADTDTGLVVCEHALTRNRFAEGFLTPFGMTSRALPGHAP